VGAKSDLIQFDFLYLLSLKSGAASEVIILANCFLLWIVRARARLCLSVVRFWCLLWRICGRVFDSGRIRASVSVFALKVKFSGNLAGIVVLWFFVFSTVCLEVWSKRIVVLLHGCNSVCHLCHYSVFAIGSERFRLILVLSRSLCTPGVQSGLEVARILWPCIGDQFYMKVLLLLHLFLCLLCYSCMSQERESLKVQKRAIFAVVFSLFWCLFLGDSCFAFWIREESLMLS